MTPSFRGQFLAYPTFHLTDGNPLESLHILNNRKPEPYWWYMKDYKHFENPSVVIHDEGHRPPRNLTLDQMKVILSFLDRQFRKVNFKAD
jgi:hypothetical protein